MHVGWSPPAKLPRSLVVWPLSMLIDYWKAILMSLLDTPVASSRLKLKVELRKDHSNASKMSAATGVFTHIVVQQTILLINALVTSWEADSMT